MALHSTLRNKFYDLTNGAIFQFTEWRFIQSHESCRICHIWRRCLRGLTNRTKPLSRLKEYLSKLRAESKFSSSLGIIISTTQPLALVCDDVGTKITLCLEAERLKIFSGRETLRASNKFIIFCAFSTAAL